MHIPVLRDKILQFLEPLEGKVILDATVGTGGHAGPVLERIGPKGRLIGLDRDAEALKIARERLSRFASRLTLVQSNFENLGAAAEQAGAARLDGVIMDLGLSSLQLEDPERGFSFSEEGPLDMRMDRRQSMTAREVVNRFHERDLEGLLREYGEERFARRIAAAIVRCRKESPLETTSQLARLVEETVPRKAWPRRIHPATRTFQALRIQVNGELENLKRALPAAISHLKAKGRFVVISYHSLEDRIVKFFFKDRQKEGDAVITKKPVTPSEEEIRENRKARSAKLRVLERAA